VATAPSGEGFYMVLIVTTPAQRDRLYESVFIPILEAFTFDGALKESAQTEQGGTGSEAGVSLISYENETFGISGLVPENWAQVQPGTYARASSATDNTLIIQKSYPDMGMGDLLEVLLPALQITGLPEQYGEHGTEYFSWKLYQTSINAPGVGTFSIDLALSEIDGVPYLVLLQAEESEYTETDMHNSIFTPMLNALTPLE
jgi:hypothetical protein